jgi:hypothetical protein
MKSKFKNLNFESIKVLSKEEKSRVLGGNGGYPQWWLRYDPHICLNLNQGFDTVKCTKSMCDAICGGVSCEPYEPAQSGGGVFNTYAAWCSTQL